MPYARIARYTTQSGTLDAILHKAEAELVPMTRQQPGFQGYALVRTGPDACISITSWESEEEAQQAGDRLAGWVRQEMGPSLEHVESHIGEVTVGQGDWPETGQYGLVNFWRFNQDGRAVAERVRDELVPLIARRHGFVGYMAVMTGDRSGVVCTAYRTQADAEQPAGAAFAGWIETQVQPITESVERHAGELVWGVRA